MKPVENTLPLVKNGRPLSRRFLGDIFAKKNPEAKEFKAYLKGHNRYALGKDEWGNDIMHNVRGIRTIWDKKIIFNMDFETAFSEINLPAIKTLRPFIEEGSIQDNLYRRLPAFARTSLQPNNCLKPFNSKSRYSRPETNCNN